jgi:hypothetical protein
VSVQLHVSTAFFPLTAKDARYTLNRRQVETRESLQILEDKKNAVPRLKFETTIFQPVTINTELTRYHYTKYTRIYLYFLSGSATQRGLWPPRHTRFLDHTRRVTVGRTPLERVISSSQRSLPDNTQHTQQTNIHAPGGIFFYFPILVRVVYFRLSGIVLALEEGLRAVDFSIMKNPTASVGSDPAILPRSQQQSGRRTTP